MAKLLPAARGKRPLVAVALLLAGLAAGAGAEGPPLKIVSFNIQVFGLSKAAKAPVMAVAAALLSDAALVAVQEVRAQNDTPALALLDALSRAAPEADWAWAIGPREGRSSSKEQYLLVYDRRFLELVASATYPDPDDLFERNPLAAYFRAVPPGLFDFILINNHLKPAAAGEEIAALPAVAAWAAGLWGESDVIIVGDFNADGAYFDEAGLAGLLPGCTSLIGDEVDTTLAASDNTYDRIILTESALEDWTGRAGVLRFDELFDFEALGIRPRDVSDHYPVWAEFAADRDTD